MDTISDFAESLVLNEVSKVREGKILPPAAQQQPGNPTGRDIREVQVPDSFMQQVLGEQYAPQEPPPADSIPELVWTDPNEEEVVQQPHSITEETVERLVPLLEEVRNLLYEMSMAVTGTGNIGVNLAGPASKEKDSADDTWEKEEKKRGYRTPTADSTEGFISKERSKDKFSHGHWHNEQPARKVGQKVKSRSVAPKKAHKEILKNTLKNKLRKRNR